MFPLSFDTSSTGIPSRARTRIYPALYAESVFSVGAILALFAFDHLIAEGCFGEEAETVFAGVALFAFLCAVGGKFDF
ncbi:hypothetical protein PENSUB_665 [Penicillium subrubescens]|uniref:Uncharacterized protein n=1 Tax=Penicillium subrubescens TaxID=1316194 RepID=A0A1Q5ULY8_9EURO|nr:hypothetical protein PENSUB_665 [Penicillium subrubescens]